MIVAALTGTLILLPFLYAHTGTTGDKTINSTNTVYTVQQQKGIIMLLHDLTNAMLCAAKLAVASLFLVMAHSALMLLTLAEWRNRRTRVYDGSEADTHTYRREVDAIDTIPTARPLARSQRALSSDTPFDLILNQTPHELPPTPLNERSIELRERKEVGRRGESFFLEGSPV